MSEPAKRFPFHGWLGLILVTVFWAVNWGLDGLRTHWGFFPLWLGYCLTVDALTLRRTGSSPLFRSRVRYLGLFAASVPAWWLFELVNQRTRNWIYDVPSVGFGRVFEMPILGYGGYLPFSLELFALYHLLAGIVGGDREPYVLPPRLDHDGPRDHRR